MVPLIILSCLVLHMTALITKMSFHKKCIVAYGKSVTLCAIHHFM